MKAAVITRYGGPDVFSYQDVPDPEAGAGEVVVRSAAASLNPVDAMDRRGDNKGWRPLDFPAVIGWDVSGVVDSVGEGVSEFEVGDRVAAWDFRTYAERVALKAEIVVRVPDGLDLVEAAAAPLATVTGSQLISIASKPRPGQTVLVSGALGAVGRAAVFTAMDRGARVIAAVRKSRLEEAAELGADDVLALDDENALSSLAPVDVVTSTVRGDAADRLLELVRPGGIYASVTGAPAGADARSDVQISNFVSKKSAQTLSYMLDAIRDGKVSLPIARRFALSETAQAHELLASGVQGKILLTP